MAHRIGHRKDLGYLRISRSSANEHHAPPRQSRNCRAHLETLGVQQGDTLFVHSSFKSLGPVAGGAGTAVDALQAAVGPRGAPAHALLPPDPGGTTGRGSGIMPRRPPPWAGSPSTSAACPTRTAPTTTRTPVAARGPGAEEFVAWPPESGGPALLLGPAALGADLRHPLAHEPRLSAGRKAAYARRRLRDLHLRPLRGGPLLGPPAANGPARPPPAPGPPSSRGLVGRPRPAGRGLVGDSPSRLFAIDSYVDALLAEVVAAHRPLRAPAAMNASRARPPILVYHHVYPERRAGAGPGGRRRRHHRRGGVPAPDALPGRRGLDRGLHVEYRGLARWRGGAAGPLPRPCTSTTAGWTPSRSPFRCFRSWA